MNIDRIPEEIRRYTEGRAFAKDEMGCSPEARAEPEQTVRLLAEGLKMMQAVDISKCPFDARLTQILEQAEINIKAGLVDTSNWEPDTVHRTPEELLRYLREFRPAVEELAFTHGDYCLPNIFFEGPAVRGFIDMGRAGVADRWQDIALCVRSLHHNFQTDGFDSLLIEALGTEPNREKIEYYILLDELF